MDLIMDVNNIIHTSKWCLTVVIATGGREKWLNVHMEIKLNSVTKTIGELGHS
jgi:hypothetical protein